MREIPQQLKYKDNKVIDADFYKCLLYFVVVFLFLANFSAPHDQRFLS